MSKKNPQIASENMKMNFSKGWGIILYQALMFFFLIGFSIDGLNIVAPAFSEATGVDYPSVLSMATVAGMIGVVVYIFIARINVKVGARLLSGVCLIGAGASYIFLGNSKTLVTYCIALTLCQLPGVDGVTIDVEGEPIPYRARQVLRPEDAALTGGEDAPIRLDASLYYLNADGSALVPEQREVTVTENGGQAAALLAAFLEGPREEGLRLPLAEGTVLLSVWTEGEVCYVNFSAPFRDEPPESPREARLLLYAIVDTMCQLPGVGSVHLLVEGESLEQFANIPTSSPLEPNWSVVAEDAG